MKWVLLAIMEIREILAVQEDLVHLAHLEKLDQRARGEVLARLACLDRKETQELLEPREPKESWGEEETLGLRARKDRTELKGKRVKWGQRA